MPDAARPQRFSSQVGFGVVAYTAVVFTGVGSILFYHRLWWVLALIVLLAFFAGHLLLTIHYIIEGQNLQIKSGFLFRQNIAIRDIRKIRSIRDYSSAPAASSDRLMLTYNKYDSVLVSPREKAAFITALLEINPGIDASSC